MNEQTTPQAQEATPATSPRRQSRLLAGLRPFHRCGFDEQYPAIKMIQALTSVLIDSRDGLIGKDNDHSFPTTDDEMAWLLLLIGDLARKIDNNLDDAVERASFTWNELEQRALNLEAQLAALSGEAGQQ